jgi:hypothetical protein
LFIELDNNGYEHIIEDIRMTLDRTKIKNINIICSDFNLLIDFQEVVKHLNKIYENLKIYLYITVVKTKTLKLFNLSRYNNIYYYLLFNNYDDKILSSEEVDFYKKCYAKFIFNCDNESSINNVKIMEYSWMLPTNLIYIKMESLDLYFSLEKICKERNYNFTLDFKKIFLIESDEEEKNDK